MPLSEADIQIDLDRRRPGTSRHVTQRNEPDAVEILSGCTKARPQAPPLPCSFATPTSAARITATSRRVFALGHADYTYWHKYGIRDPRGGGRSSARLTAPPWRLVPWPRNGCCSNTARSFARAA